MVDLEKLFMVRAHKFGVVYCKENQTGSEMFNNSMCPPLFSFPLTQFAEQFQIVAEGDADFEDFLNVIGDRISLQDWKGYCGGLDVKSMYLHSIFVITLFNLHFTNQKISCCMTIREENLYSQNSRLVIPLS